MPNSYILQASCSSMSSAGSLWYYHNKLFPFFSTLFLAYSTQSYLWSSICLYLAYNLLPYTAAEGSEDVNVVVIGGGVSGINAGVKLRERGLKYVILEKSSSIGGTWWDNIYPGCACDIQSHLYSFSFYPNPFWSHKYSPALEIRR